MRRKQLARPMIKCLIISVQTRTHFDSFLGDTNTFMYSHSYPFTVTCSVRLKTFYPLLTSLQISMNVSLVTHVIAVHRVRIRTDPMYVPVTEATPETGTPVEVEVNFSFISAVIGSFTCLFFRCLTTCSPFCLSFLSLCMSRCQVNISDTFLSAPHRIVLFNLHLLM